MIPKSGNRFSEKIMLKKNVRARPCFVPKRYGSKSLKLELAPPLRQRAQP